MSNKNSSSIAYYENGMPHAADGSIVITITGGPENLQPLPTTSIPADMNKIPLYAGLEPGNIPIYSLPPGVGSPPHSGAPAYKPDSFTKIVPIVTIFEVSKEINSKIKNALEHYPENIEDIKKKSKVLLSELNKTEIKTLEPFSSKITKITDALAALEKAVNEKNLLEEKIKEKQKIADTLFDETINDQMVRLNNFKGFLKDRPDIFDAAYASMMNMSHGKDNPVAELWRTKVEIPNNELILLKNNQLTLLNMINTINKDIAVETENLTEEKEKEDTAIKDVVKFTADFHKEVSNVYGEKAEQLAEALEKQVKGKKIRNVEDAIKAWEKHKTHLNKKINAKDREAIAKALESIKVEDIAKNLRRFSKSMGYTSKVIDLADWSSELYTAIKTNNWRSFFVKTEAIVGGAVAGAVAGFAFSIILGAPVGVLGYALIMAAIGALVNDELVEKVNVFLGI